MEITRRVSATLNRQLSDNQSGTINHHHFIELEEAGHRIYIPGHNLFPVLRLEIESDLFIEVRNLILRPII